MKSFKLPTLFSLRKDKKYSKNFLFGNKQLAQGVYFFVLTHIKPLLNKVFVKVRISPMEEKYIRFYRTFHKKFKNKGNLILCSNLNSDGGIDLSAGLNNLN